jgi:predicted nucleotidyltransferase
VTSDDLPFDLAKIGELLEQHDVRYVVIGGMSGAFHGMVDYRTKDVDLLVHNTIVNLDRRAAALTELGAVPLGTDDRRAILGTELQAASTQWDTDAGPVDVLVTAAWSNESIVVYSDIERGSTVFDVGRGIAMPAASLDDLIRMKEAAGRHKDHLALPELRRLRGDANPQQPTGYDPFGDFDIEDGAD